MRVVFEVIREITPSLKADHLDLIFEKIQTVNVTQYDEKTLNFLEDYTGAALEASYDLQNQAFGEQGQTVYYDDFLKAEQKKFSLNLGAVKENP